MKQDTKIQWTDATWNPLAGCFKISDGCKNCYAIKDAVRLAGNPNEKVASKYAGTTANGNWTGKINLASDDVLTQPLRWTRPRRIFVNSMSDLFHESVPDEWIDRVFAVMALSPQHTFQILTKRAERMRDYFATARMTPSGTLRPEFWRRWHIWGEIHKVDASNTHFCWSSKGIDGTWPLPNVWLGVSVENQKAADERIPHLLQTPAAVRFLSVEPLLDPVDLFAVPRPDIPYFQHRGETGAIGPASEPDDYVYWCKKGLHWVIVGGESGPNARPCNIEWIQSIVDQCQEAKTPVFVKQLGAGFEAEYHKRCQVWNHDGKSYAWKYKDKKGGEPSEWPEDLRVREFPGVTK